MSTIIRRGARPADHFTIIANGLLRDARLSLKARGLAAWLLTHTESFELSADRIARLTNTGISAVRTGLQELESAGYLTRTEQRDARNRMTGMVYEITDSLPTSEPQSENLTTENPPAENQTPYKKTNSKNTTGKKITTTAAPAAADAPVDAPKVNGGQVVAAFVDAYRLAHQGHDPLSQDVRKVAGTAKRLLADPKVDTDVLLRAATSLGRSQFTDLGGQYRRELSQPGAGQRGQGVTYVQAEVQPGRWDALLAQQEETNRRITQGNPTHLEASA